MAEILNFKRGVFLSIRQFSGEVGLDRDTITRRINEVGLIAGGERGGHPVYRLRDLIDLTIATGANGQFDPDRMHNQFQRKAYFQAEITKLTLMTERGELIPRIEVEQEMARAFKAIVQTLESLPDTLERDAGLTSGQAAKVEAALDKSRTDAYAMLSGNDSTVAAAQDPEK